MFNVCVHAWSPPPVLLFLPLPRGVKLYHCTVEVKGTCTSTHTGWLCLPGIPDRHHLRSDVDRQSPPIQQHNENTDSEQQYGRTHLAAWYHLQELQERWFPLDNDAEPAPENMERREDTLHLKVPEAERWHSDMRCTLSILWPFFFFFFFKLYEYFHRKNPFVPVISSSYTRKQSHYTSFIAMNEHYLPTLMSNEDVHSLKWKQNYQKQKNPQPDTHFSCGGGRTGRRSGWWTFSHVWICMNTTWPQVHANMIHPAEHTTIPYPDPDPPASLFLILHPIIRWWKCLNQLHCSQNEYSSTGCGLIFDWYKDLSSLSPRNPSWFSPNRSVVSHIINISVFYLCLAFGIYIFS